MSVSVSVIVSCLLVDQRVKHSTSHNLQATKVAAKQILLPIVFDSNQK